MALLFITYKIKTTKMNPILKMRNNLKYKYLKKEYMIP